MSFIDAGERIVGVFLMKAKGQGSGVEIERRDAVVITMRAGKWVRVDYYNNRDQGPGNRRHSLLTGRLARSKVHRVSGLAS